MASHVPFLAVRPDDQFSSDVIQDAPGSRNDTTMDSLRKLPTAVRFPLACLLSLGLSTGLYSIVASTAGVELASVSRDLQDPWAIGGLVAWKTAGLAFAWYASYDCTFRFWSLPFNRKDERAVD